MIMRAIMEPNWGRPAPELLELPWKSDSRMIFQHMPRNSNAVYGLANDFRQEPAPAQAAAHPNAPKVYRSVLFRQAELDARSAVAASPDRQHPTAEHVVSEGTPSNDAANNINNASAGGGKMSLKQVCEGTSILYSMLDPASTISLMARELQNTKWGKQRAPAPTPDLGPMPDYLPATKPSDPQPTVIPRLVVAVVQPFRAIHSALSSLQGESGSTPQSPGSPGSIGSQLLFADADDTGLLEAMTGNLSMENEAAEIDALMQSPAASPDDWEDPELDDLLPEEE